ncbi:hypothetical protein BGZ94_008299 [Podila epigama]|nr:hypothetical protein BGZ94_008299 [Podila epigama]
MPSHRSSQDAGTECEAEGCLLPDYAGQERSLHEDEPLLSRGHPAIQGSFPQGHRYDDNFSFPDQNHNHSHGYHRSYQATDQHHPPTTPVSPSSRLFKQAWHFISEFELTVPQKRILKASLAYLLGCLVSFTPFFRPYVGLSGHLAATSAVFFNPAKTMGRMVDAVFAGICAISFGLLVSITSLASAIWFNKYDLYVWGHFVSVIVFGGGSTFMIAFAKARYNRPTVSVGKCSKAPCTLAHILILVILTKEGAASLGEFNLTRVFTITCSMVLGVIISVLVCIFVWPESAHARLRKDMAASLGSFRVLIKLLTKTFLLEEDTTPFGSQSVQSLIESQMKSFSALANSLEEARLEFPATDIKEYEECVKSLNTLAQYLNGLRSSCGLEYDMLKRDEQQNPGAGAGTGTGASIPTATGNRPPISPLRGVRGHALSRGMSSYSLIGSIASESEQSASEGLIEFLDHVGKPMKSLALTCKLTIEHLQDIFTISERNRSATKRKNASKFGSVYQQPNQSQYGYETGENISDSTEDNGNTGAGISKGGSSKRKPSLVLMQLNLVKALDIFEAANAKALKRFYSHHNQRHSAYFPRPLGSLKHMSGQNLATGVGTTVENEEPASSSTEGNAPVGEQIFLVYFFVFNLMEFSKELTRFVSCVEVLVGGDEELALWIERSRQTWWSRIWFMCTGFPRRFRKPTRDDDAFAAFDNEPGLDASGTNAGNHDYTRQQDHDQGLGHVLAHNHSERHTVKYAAKAAISTVILLIPAFVDWSRPYFVQYRGEWALISMLIVMVPTVGGTNIVGLYRILGTLAGCYLGVAVYILFPAHDILLPICCFLFAVPNFYLVLCSAYARIGQVTLLAFNLVLLQTYNRQHHGPMPPGSGDDDDDDSDELTGDELFTRAIRMVASTVMSDVWRIAFHRAVAVSLGVVIGVGVTNYVWPYEARVELRKGLSDLLLNISWLYNRLVSVYSTNLDRVVTVPSQERYRESRSKFQNLLKKTTFRQRFRHPEGDISRVVSGEGEVDIETMNKEFMAIELSLQLQLLKLNSLLAETPNEPRLKGKFPAKTYKNMLDSCQNILDRFLSMRLVITKDQWLESARRDFIVPVNKERREMVGNVLLYFYTIASALRLKTPLPPYLPPANKARLRLIQKIRQLPVVQNKAVLTDDYDERYIFYYAYALVMDDVIRELERLGHWSQDLFGVITPVSEFEAWFTDDGYPPQSTPTQQRQQFLSSSPTGQASLSPCRDLEEPCFQEGPVSMVQSVSADMSESSKASRRPSQPLTRQNTQTSDHNRERMLFSFDSQDSVRNAQGPTLINSAGLTGALNESASLLQSVHRLGSSQSLAYERKSTTDQGGELGAGIGAYGSMDSRRNVEGTSDQRR